MHPADSFCGDHTAAVPHHWRFFSQSWPRMVTNVWFGSVLVSSWRAPSWNSCENELSPDDVMIAQAPF